MFTSLKALKWAHDLGIKQERQRIARFLENEVNHLSTEYGVETDMLNNTPSTAKRNKMRLEIKHAATMRVSEIVGSVLDPQYADKSMASFMFPDQEKK